MRRACGRAASLAGMVILGIMPCFVHHTCMCRAYGLLAFWEWVQHLGQWVWIPVFALSGVGVLGTRSEGMPVIMALAIVPFLLCLRPPFTRLFFDVGKRGRG